MSVQAVSWALDQDIDNPALKLLLVAICNYVDGGLIYWSGQEALSKDASMSTRSIQRHLKELEVQGYIRRESRRGDDGSKLNDYIHVLSQGDKLAGGLPDKPGSSHTTTVSPTFNGERKGDKKRGRARVGNAAPALPVVTVARGSQAFRDWISHWRANGVSVRAREKMAELTVPSEYPPVGKSEAA
jgi:DNA-binding MarR family transcriptional regulator